MVKTVYHRIYAIDFYSIEKGNLSDTKCRRQGIWQKEGKRLYVSCLSCWRILEIDSGDVDDEGYVYPCIVCWSAPWATGKMTGCGSHLWYKLENWNF